MTTTSSVTTNTNDYAPGSYAIITATGFNAGSTVTFEVDHVSDPGADGIYGTADDVVIEMGGDGHDAWTITDGGEGDLDGVANGTVITTWYVNPDDSADERFLITASTSSGWFASNTFTDAKPVTGLGEPPVPNNPGGSFITPFLVSSSSGTGIIQSIVKIASNDTFEQGYNSDFRDVQFDETTAANFNRAITLSQIPIVNIAGTDYREFDLDLNEDNGSDNPLITLQTLMIFASDTNLLTGFDATTQTFPAGTATLLFDMDAAGDVSTLLTDWNSGSGTGDYAFFIPELGVNSLPGFDGLSQGTYIYIYSEFGTLNGTGSGVSGGFEEWFVVSAPNPSMEIEKFASIDDNVADAAGDVIHYDLTVSNVGNVDLTGVTVTDPYADAGSIVRGADITGDNDNTLEIGEVWSYTATHTVTQAEIDNNGASDGFNDNGVIANGFIDNTATADSTQTDPVSDSASIPILQLPSLNIVKDASMDDGDPAADEDGDVINYVITVQNTGNMTLTDVSVTDPYADAGSIVRGLDVVGDDDDLLEVGETWGYTATHTVTQAEIDSNGGGDGLLENTATADSDETDSDTDDADVPVDLNPALMIEKVTVYNGTTGDGLTGVHVGDAIGWRYSVTNTGNTALTNVTVTDDNGTSLNLADDFFAGYVSGDTIANGLLDVGETWIFEANGTAIAGTYSNIGTAEGVAADGQEAIDSDPSSYTAIPREALIAPTGTTPYQYISGTAMTFQEYYDYQGGVIQYSVKGGKINQTNPGVFFYFTGASGDIVGADGADAGTAADTMTVTVDQTRTGGSTSAFLPLNNNNIQLYKVNDLNSNGTVDSGDSLTTIKLNSNQISVNADGDVSVTFTPDAVGSMYVISVKYQTSTVVGNNVGTNPGAWPTVNYNFDTVLNGGIIETYDGGVDLAPKPANPMLLAGEGGDGAHAVNQHQMHALVQAAIAYWAAQGEDVSSLQDVSFEVADLGMQGDDWILGLTQGDHITIDDDAAGHGWSVGIGAVAPDRVDLLSVLVHEMGHVLGMDDEALGDMLAVGDRMLPSGDAEGGDEAVASLPEQAQALGMIGLQEAEQHVNFS